MSKQIKRLTGHALLAVATGLAVMLLVGAAPIVVAMPAAACLSNGVWLLFAY